ncbi:hypothetical protein D9615_005797 [Tricholomella constricta]|uniref:Uncharacterized protein n=1 Tax=Tricholomella constricta TaxID=117010 RepID=A0A8H5M3X9_9AGAR|nr:hypothetical protein D9615_005797 [Tricholomella constricta]
MADNHSSCGIPGGVGSADEQASQTVTADDALAVAEPDSYHADDETSDSEDASLYGMTDDESDNSWPSSNDYPSTPQLRANRALLTRKLPQISRRRGVRAPGIRLSTDSTQSSYTDELAVPWAESPQDQSSIYDVLPPLTPGSDSDVLVPQNTPSRSPYTRDHFTTRQAFKVSRDLSYHAFAPRIPDSPNSSAAEIAPAVREDKGKRPAMEDELKAWQHGGLAKLTPTTSATPAPLTCDAENCLEGQFKATLYGQLPRLPNTTSHIPITSLRPGCSTMNMPPLDCADDNLSSSWSVIENGPHDFPTKIHRPRAWAEPSVRFKVHWKDADKTIGVSLADIIHYEGVYMQRAFDPLQKLWGKAAPGTTIKLLVHWKGHVEEKVYDIVVKCKCGFVIRRCQLGLAIAKAQASYFETTDLEPSYMPPEGEDEVDPFHPSNFIIKNPYDLHLMYLFTKDNGETYRAQHAIVEDHEALATELTKPPPKPKCFRPDPNNPAHHPRLIKTMLEHIEMEERRERELLEAKQREAKEIVDAYLRANPWTAEQEALALEEAKQQQKDREECAELDRWEAHYEAKVRRVRRADERERRKREAAEEAGKRR